MLENTQGIEKKIIVKILMKVKKEVHVNIHHFKAFNELYIDHVIVIVIESLDKSWRESATVAQNVFSSLFAGVHRKLHFLFCSIEII